jgi:hypothetical protein
MVLEGRTETRLVRAIIKDEGREALVKFVAKSSK